MGATALTQCVAVGLPGRHAVCVEGVTTVRGGNACAVFQGILAYHTDHLIVVCREGRVGYGLPGYLVLSECTQAKVAEVCGMLGGRSMTWA